MDEGALVLTKILEEVFGDEAELAIELLQYYALCACFGLVSGLILGARWFR
jgi:hypothetical protein